ncbi:MAG: hypothetical protein COA38_10275 [Fluviicola sp.]|nr:MAG: hypothetical protein COA38_10275 [Fluviicola sp.]
MTKLHLYTSWVAVIAFSMIGFSQLETVTLSPQNEQWVKKQTNASGGSLTYFSGNSNASKTIYNYASGNGNYQNIRFYFNHPAFENADITQLLLTITYSDLNSGAGASIANVVVPSIGMNNSVPWNSTLNSSEQEDLFNAIQWGNIVFNSGIGTNSITNITETLLIYDQSTSGFPSTTIANFETNATNFTIGLIGAVGTLNIESISATITYDCGAVAVAPASLNISGITSSGANLTWTQIPDATSYDIFRNGSFIGSSATNNYTATLNSNTSYTFKVRGKNDCGVGPFSSSIPIATCLPVPLNLNVSGITTTSANLTWSGSSSVPYNILVNSVSVGSVNSTNYSLTGLTPGANHNIQVIRTGIPCNSDPANINVTTVPSTPTGLVASGTGPNQIGLSWSSISGATAYKIYDCTTSSYLYNSTNSSIAINNLNPNTFYEYKVSALNNSGESAQTTCASATTLLNTPIINCLALSETEIQIDWASITSASEYEIYDCSNNYISSTTSTSFIHTGLNQATQYYYQIKAISTSNHSLKSNCQSTITLPETPTGLVATAISDNSILLEWTSNTGPSGLIEVFSTAGTFIVNTTGNFHLVNGLNPNSNYSYKIRQTTPLTASSFTSPASTFTLLPTPQNLISTPISTSEAELSWDNVQGADYYDVYDCTGTFISSTGLGDPSMIIGGLSEGVLYQYKVQGKNNNTESKLSTCVNTFTKLQTPTGLNVTGTSSSTVNVSWSQVTSATSYNLYSCGGTFIANTTSTSYSVSGLLPNSSYSYKVIASYVSPLLPPSTSINGNATSDFSTCASDYTWLNAPTAIWTSTVSTTQIELEWNPVASATSYLIEDCANGFVANTSSTSYIIGGLNPGTVYEFKIKPQHPWNQSEWSNCEDGMTGLETPVLSVTGSTSSTISLSWTPITGCTGYLLEYCSGGVIGSASSATTNYTVSGLSQQTTYEFKVKATFIGAGGGSIGGTNSSPFSTCASGSTTAIIGRPKNLGSNLEIGDQVIIAPNPFSETLNIESEGINSISIHSLSGEVVRTQKLTEPIDQISLRTDLSPGIYFVIIHSINGNTSSHKVIKQ